MTSLGSAVCLDSIALHLGTSTITWSCIFWRVQSNWPSISSYHLIAPLSGLITTVASGYLTHSVQRVRFQRFWFLCLPSSKTPTSPSPSLFPAEASACKMSSSIPASLRLFVWDCAGAGHGQQMRQEDSDRESLGWLAVRTSGKGVAQEVEGESIRDS